MSASKESARDAVPDARRAPRDFLEHLYRVAVERALPLASMGAHLPAPPAKGRTLVLGAGKAGGSMAQALDALWPADAPLSGLSSRATTTFRRARPGCPSASNWSRRRIRCPMKPGGRRPSASWA